MVKQYTRPGDERMSEAKNAIYAQSGGVTAVINASACGVIQTAQKYQNQINKVSSCDELG